jgi:menaquinone-dependent protoporphyrinogen oxidase
MTRVLIVYGTGEGQTAKISERIARMIRNRGHTADAVDAGDLAKGSTTEGYDAAIVGASIHMGKHEDYVRDFVRENRALLESIPSAFFSVSLTAHDATEKARKEVEGYVESFEEETGWRPDKVAIFAGALLYTHYGFIKRRMMKKIVRDTGNPDTDTSRDYEYTDWNEVERFTEEFLEEAARQLAPNARERG